jgi:ABC-type antimicrobial peptide transport system permease subunit
VIRIGVAPSKVGLALALLTVRYIESLLYQVKATDAATFILPALTLFTVAALASVPAAIAAARIDPVEMLRAE